jgi:hypothetical protein
MKLGPWKSLRLPASALAICLGGHFPQVANAQSAGATEPIPEWLGLSSATRTCGDFVLDSREAQYTDLGWMLGYISGRNREAPVGSRTVGRSYTTAMPVLIWVQNYCRKHPFDDLIKAADKLREDFIKREQSGG